MKNFLFNVCLAFAAILSVCSCSSSHETIDSWEMWVAYKTTNIDRYYWTNCTDEGEVDFKMLFPEGVHLEKWNGGGTVTDSRVIAPIMKTLMNKLYDRIKSTYIKGLDDNIAPDRTYLISTLIPHYIDNNYMSDDGEHYVLYGPPYSEVGRHPTKYNADWLLGSEENISILVESFTKRMGTFNNMRDFINNHTSVFSSTLIEKEKQYKLYEVIYNIHYGDVDRYVLCNVLIQKDGSSEIEIVNKSNNLMNLI